MKIKKPILIYDGDCGFCKYWIERWKQRTGEKIEYKPYQEVGDRYDINKEQFQKSVWLVMPDGSKFAAAEAVFESLAIAGNTKWRWACKNIPLLGKFFEFCYKVVANNRSFFFRLTLLIFGDEK